MPDDSLKHTFNEAARLYDAARPRYPEELFDALVEAAHLPPEAKLLEIGPGTGQATQSLAKRGYWITAIELGANLAEIARESLKGYTNVNILTGAFEDLELAPESFHLVYAATSFHWLKPEAKFAKPFRILERDGHLAIIQSEHVTDREGDAFFFASRPIYEKYTADYDPKFRLLPIENLQPPEIDNRFFDLVFCKPFPLVIAYTGKQYADLVNTYSPQLAMDPARRKAFLTEIADLIDRQFGGSIQHHFAMMLTVARRKVLALSDQQQILR